MISLRGYQFGNRCNVAANRSVALTFKEAKALALPVLKGDLGEGLPYRYNLKLKLLKNKGIIKRGYEGV